MLMISAQDQQVKVVFEMVVAFFNLRARPSTEEGDKEEQGRPFQNGLSNDDSNVVPVPAIDSTSCPNGSMSSPNLPYSPSLLEIAYMGGVEKTIQGELFYYLSAQLRPTGLFPVLEYGLSRRSLEGKLLSRNIDIMVFNQASEPLVAIELKNHSLPSNPKIKPLCDGLEADAQKLRPFVIQNSSRGISNNEAEISDNEPINVPLIQIGTCTTIEAISQASGNPPVSGPLSFPLYRFLTAYAHRKVNYKWNSHLNDFNSWISGMSWKYAMNTGLIQGRRMQVNALDNRHCVYVVKGRINHFVGLII